MSLWFDDIKIGCAFCNWISWELPLHSILTNPKDWKVAKIKNQTLLHVITKQIHPTLFHISILNSFKKSKIHTTHFHLKNTWINTQINKNINSNNFMHNYTQMNTTLTQMTILYIPTFDPTKNSSMELAVIWGNFGCSDLACSDLVCSDLACSGLAHSHLVCSDLAHSDLGHIYLSKFLLVLLNIHNMGTLKWNKFDQMELLYIVSQHYIHIWAKRIAQYPFLNFLWKLTF